MKGDEKLNKKLILSLLGVSLLSTTNSNLILETEASNTSKIQEDLSPLITYITEKIGDREKMKVTVTVEDRSGSGIKEFRDHNNNLINSNTITVEFNRRVNATFIAIDNNNNKSEINIDLNWINPYTSTKPIEDRLKRGSGYWASSNLREWLNSDSNKVSYTSFSPTDSRTNGNGYDNEAGFLNQFTESEKDAIAIAEHRVLVNDNFDVLSRESGKGVLGHPNSPAPTLMGGYYGSIINYKNFANKKELDKVYLLSHQELYWYLTRRGFNSQKVLTPEAKLKHNYSKNAEAWFLHGSSTSGPTEIPYTTRDNNLYGYAYASDKRGVVPVVNIKPDYIFKNGKKARDLKIGEYVYFGTYLDAPILWQVINKFNDNHPMLISDKIIDLKPMDAIGDQSRMYSDFISYDKADVSRYDDIEYTSTNETSDISPPIVRILNKDDLECRQNQGFNLNFEIVDEESGLDYAILPNGNKIYTNNFSYYIDSNKNYLFKFMDNSGNFNEFFIPVGNINQEPILDISSSANTAEWSNNDIYINIKSSNSVSQYHNFKLTNGHEYHGAIFPNYCSYTNKTFNVSGTINLLSITPEALNEPNSAIKLGIRYKRKGENEYTYTSSYNWVSMYEVPIKELYEKGSIDFNFEFTVPNDYSNELMVWINSGMTGYYGEWYKAEFVNVNYEISDDSDFAINSIELPNGQIINNVKEYRDIISEDGIHNLTYKVIDNRDKITQKTITVKVDKTAPTLNLNYNTNITNQNIVVNISASDATSGVKRIKLPNGNYITNLNSTYTISGDGEYTFECEDVAGNITTKTITINNIDKEKPSITIDKNKTEWTNKPIKININTRD